MNIKIYTRILDRWYSNGMYITAISLNAKSIDVVTWVSVLTFVYQYFWVIRTRSKISVLKSFLLNHSFPTTPPTHIKGQDGSISYNHLNTVNTI